MEYNYNNLTVEVENKIAVVTLNRPEALNALNQDLLDDISNFFTDSDSDPNIQVIILTGKGEKAFVAGADIKELVHLNSQQGEELATRGQENVFDKIEDSKKPVIAAVNGFALGGGLELAMAAHFRIASKNAKLGLPEVTLGLIPGYGGTQRLPKLIGKGRAMQAIMTADMFTADRAYEIGLVNEVVEQAELINRAKEIADKISKNSFVAIRNAIRSINAYDKENGFEIEIENFGSLFEEEHFKEGTTAFIEKRKPNFK
ncbi:enoyl-CoA hydratase/isomerase family protein [Empedobacter brevis]|uniref:enoyl-CoA hydratase/isomerase family protein n=1 Tax=Empedobacter brevis TaxID=247 RepID=UPI0039B04108